MLARDERPTRSSRRPSAALQQAFGGERIVAVLLSQRLIGPRMVEVRTE